MPPSTPPVCPCGSKRSFSDCCERFLSGEPAGSPEELMRSRYTAYVLGDETYLKGTWHPSTRPPRLDTVNGPQWTGLEVRDHQGGGPGADEGTVEFVARYRDGEKSGALHETSRFLREGGLWYYLDGEYAADSPSHKAGRNEPCPCGSGRKFKRCCGR